MIRSSYYQSTKPEDIVKDSRGMTFSIGDTVAYNLSGDVVIGTILEIKKNSWYCKRGNSWYLDFEMLVKFYYF